MYVSGNFHKKLEGLEPYLKDVITSLMDEIESKFSAHSDFSELKHVIGELANDQRETKKEVRGLAEAQKRTEVKVEELAEAQKRTEVKVEELAEVQKETKKELKELAGAQRRTEMKMEELAEAQKETKKELKDVKKQLGGLSMDVGYGIEDKIIPYIPVFGKKEFGIDVSLVDRRNIVYSDGKYDEVNIYAEGTKNGKLSFVVGECKAQPGKKDFDKFSRMAERVKKILTGEVFCFIAGYHFTPDTESYAKRKYPHIRIYRSFEFEMKYSKRR